MRITYTNCKKIIISGSWEKLGYNDMAQKLDVFYLGSRLTEDEYKELMNLLNKAAGDASGEEDVVAEPEETEETESK